MCGTPVWCNMHDVDKVQPHFDDVIIILFLATLYLIAGTRRGCPYIRTARVLELNVSCVGSTTDRDDQPSAVNYKH